jgi:hypothetical protein
MPLALIQVNDLKDDSIDSSRLQMGGGSTRSLSESTEKARSEDRSRKRPQARGGYDRLRYARGGCRENVPDAEETSQVPLPRSAVHSEQDDAYEECDVLRAGSEPGSVEYICG